MRRDAFDYAHEGMCMTCSGPRDRVWIEITTLDDSQPRYVAGAWDSCYRCGSSAEPAVLTYWMGPVQGPALPTPDDILRAAGHDVL